MEIHRKRTSSFFDGRDLCQCYVFHGSNATQGRAEQPALQSSERIHLTDPTQAFVLSRFFPTYASWRHHVYVRVVMRIR